MSVKYRLEVTTKGDAQRVSRRIDELVRHTDTKWLVHLSGQEPCRRPGAIPWAARLVLWCMSMLPMTRPLGRYVACKIVGKGQRPESKKCYCCSKDWICSVQAGMPLAILRSCFGPITP